MTGVDATGRTNRTTRIVVPLDQPTLDTVDAMVEDGLARSRAAIARPAVAELAERHTRAELGRRITQEYVRRPQTDAEIGWSDAGTVAMIAAGPW